MILFEKIYDSNSIVDVELDVFNVINESEVNTDEHGFHVGEFKITIEWKDCFDD